MLAQQIENGGFDSAEAEVIGIAANLCSGEADCGGIAVGGELIDDRAAGIAEGQHLRDFIVGFAGSVIARATDAPVVQRRLAGSRRAAISVLAAVFDDAIQNCVTAGDNQADRWKLWRTRGCLRLEENRVHVAFEVIYGNQRLAQRHSQRFAVRYANDQRADQAGAARYGHRADVAESDACLRRGFSHHWDDAAQMFARRQFGDYAAIFAVNINLRCDHAGKNRSAAGDNGRRGFIARRFNAED